MSRVAHFDGLSRLLHWTMAAMILTMLFTGAAMASSLNARVWLIGLHRPLGVAVLLLAIVRLVNRLRHRPPPLPVDLPGMQVFAARASHWLLYALMLAQPLVGWALLSAGGYPVTLWDGARLPALVPHDAALYGRLRAAHALLAWLLFATVLLHLAAALFHAWVLRDGVFASMARGPRGGR